MTGLGFGLGDVVAYPDSTPPLVEAVGGLVLALSADPADGRGAVPAGGAVRVVADVGDAERPGPDGAPAPVDDATLAGYVEGADDPRGPGRPFAALDAPGRYALALPAGALPADRATGVAVVAQRGTAQQAAARLVVVTTTRA